MKSIIEKFKMPIDKKDILPVLKSGIFLSVIGGLLIGAFHLLFTYLFRFSLSWLFLIILASLIAKRIKYSYQTHHILYQVISIIFFFFAFYLMSLTMYVGLYFLYGYINISEYIVLLNPLQYFDFLSPFQTYFFTLNNLLDVFFFIIGIIYAYIYSK